MKAKKNHREKKLINFLLLGMVLVLIIWIGIEEFEEKNMKENSFKMLYYTQNLSTQAEKKTQEISITEAKSYPKEKIIEEYRGYRVMAKLEIPNINLNTYVLEQYSKEALNQSVTKFWGVDANQRGNFCIAGHNFQNQNMFHNLKKLVIGDSIFILDRKVGKIEYEVYDIYVVEPEDVSCLSQDTRGNREVTLITCTNDSKRRIIIKGREVQ